MLIDIDRSFTFSRMICLTGSLCFQSDLVNQNEPECLLFFRGAPSGKRDDATSCWRWRRHATLEFSKYSIGANVFRSQGWANELKRTTYKGQFVQDFEFEFFAIVAAKDAWFCCGVFHNLRCDCKVFLCLCFVFFVEDYSKRRNHGRTESFSAVFRGDVC